ncbi:Uncharacterised protein [Enterococcus cecorum]|uniref:fibronectin-binding protein FnbA n=1 Tax=Enterococcus cecorum TaxID=44008 RepID=UPI000DF8A1EB|nr:LPXTG cell wall anchor domain-containing protein [Enterococcus cecorum]STP83967.1 Uncharacterised protein [Enterococcus cecorum]
MEKQKKYTLRKIAGYGLVSCAVGLVLIGTHSAYAEENALERTNAEIISNEVETNMDLSDEKINVSEVYSDTDKLKVTVTRTIYFKDKETNKDVANPIVQTIDVKETRTGSSYYVNHENAEEPNNSILPEVKTPQIKGLVADRDVVQSVDISKNVYDSDDSFHPRITDTQAIVYYTNVTPSQEQPSLDLAYTEEEMQTKAQLTGQVNLYIHKYEPNGEIHKDTLTFSDFIYDVNTIEKIIGENYRLPMYIYSKNGIMNPTVTLDKPMKTLDSLIAFHRDYVPNVQSDFIYTLNQYYLDENGEKVQIFEIPSTITYHLDENGLSVEDHLKELTVAGEAKVGSGYISHNKGGSPSTISGVRYQISPNTLLPKAFEYEGNFYIPMSKSIPLRNLYVDYDNGKTTRQATYTSDIVYRRINHLEHLDTLANTGADTFKIVIDGFNTLAHTTHIPVVSHYSWDKENGLQVTYELKHVDVTHFSDEKVQFEEISLVDLNNLETSEESRNYDEHMAKPTQAIKIRYKLFLSEDKYIQTEQIANMNYKTTNDSVFEIVLGRMLTSKEEAAIQSLLSNPEEQVVKDSKLTADILIKYDKDGKHLTEMPTVVRVAFTQPKQYRLNGNALEETFGEIVPVGDMIQMGLQSQELQVLDIGNVAKTDTAIDLHVLDSYSGMDKEKILGSLNERIQPYLEQSSQVRVFLLIAKDRIREANPAYINEFHSNYFIYPIVIPENEITSSTIKTFHTTIHYRLPHAEVDSEEQVALPDDFNFDNVVDEPTQTEKSELKDSGTQTDTPSISDSGVQTDNPDTSDTGTQTKVEIPVIYQYEDGTVYKSFTITEDKGYILDSSDLEMLPDNMDFVDDFVTYEVKGDGTDSIVRIVKKNVVDQGSQTDAPSTNDGSSQTDEPTTSDNGTQTDKPDTTDTGTQTNSLPLAEKKPAKPKNNKPNLLQKHKMQYTSSSKNSLPQAGAKEQASLGILGLSMMVFSGFLSIFNRKNHKN